MANKTKIPYVYVKILSEKDKPTAYIMDKKTKEMRGRLEKGDTLTKAQKKKWIAGKRRGRTRVIRMKKDYKGFKKGQVVGRTKKIYPNQPNTVLVRAYKRKGRLGRIRMISVRKHNRKIYKG